MIFSPMSTMNRTSVSPSFVRKRDLPTPPPSLSDVNDSSSCSSSYSTTTTSTHSDQTTTTATTTVSACDLLNILTDIRFRPVFQAIEDIKRRKCRPDLERILKYVAKRYPTKNPSDQRTEILVILDELLKYGIINKVFHKGGSTIRIKNEKYVKLIENMNLCSNQQSPTIPQETMPVTLFEPQSIFHSNNNHKRETPSPEFGMFKTEECQMTKENNFTSNKKRVRSRTDSSITKTKKSRLNKTLDSDEDHTRKPLVTNNNLPPVTIEQLLGLRGDIPDVHHWTIDDLIEFFHQQGYEYASIVLNQHQINGDKLYQLTRDQVFRMSTLKIGKALKLWNVIEQIQRNNISSSS